MIAALLWGLLDRVPLILNAPVHLDSDLAVDGLTLHEALHGHWRWHYPGTPYMGTLPVLLSLPQAAAFGANPATLVSGGAVAWSLLTLAVFALAWRAFGRVAAAWSLVPLAFASTGALWLSGRVTGGHVLTGAWHAGALALLHLAWSRGGAWPAAALGAWCGLGLWLDSMFIATLAGVVPAALLGWVVAGMPRKGLAAALAFGLGLVVGGVPREVGRRVEPYDAYPAQFALVTNRNVLEQHAALLFQECLPRLAAGHRLPGYQSDPDPASLGNAAPLGARGEASPLAVATTWTALVLFAGSFAALAWSAVRPEGIAPGVVAGALLLSSGFVVAGFVANQNIYNADNYRYLVTLLVPGALGFGLAARGLSRLGPGGRAAAVVAGLLLALLVTLDTARWYARLGWIDAHGRPVRRPLDYPALDWVNAHPEVRDIYAGYWDVYRLSFLSGGRLRGKPFTIFPDRFPEWSRDLPGGRPEVTVITPGPGSGSHMNDALRDGAQLLTRGRGVAVLRWPVPGAAKSSPRQPARPES